MKSVLRGRWGRITFYRDAQDIRDEQDFVVAIMTFRFLGIVRIRIFGIGLAW